MELIRHRTVIDASEGADIGVVIHSTASGLTWSIGNRGRSNSRVRSVGVAFTIHGVVGRLRMFRHGYQSWSPSGLAVAGIDTDPARTAGSIDQMLMAHHADGRRPAPGQLRSELVTVLADDHDAILAGFLGGDRHDGTFWVGSGRSGNELVVQAFLGDIDLAPGEERDLHEVRFDRTDDPSTALERWAGECGRRNGARVTAPYQVGWCSWYHYFDDIDERRLGANLDRCATDWPFEIFQIDDGYQAAVGDWTEHDDRFPRVSSPGRGGARRRSHRGASGSRRSSSRRTRGRTGASRLGRPGADGHPLIASYNEHWGGLVGVLDTSNPDVLAHLERTASELVGMGFDYLKLDFAYAPTFDGRYRDTTLTPAQRVRAGFDAIRAGAGETTFLLGCGAPSVRASVWSTACASAPTWRRGGSPRPELWPFPGYADTLPATLNAWRNTLCPRVQHRGLWINDPDCLMLRTDETELTPDQIRAWAHCVAASGGMALVSDDLAVLDQSARSLFDEVIDIGRRVDSAAVSGSPARCADLMSAPIPTRLTSPGIRFEGQPRPGSATVTLDGSVDRPRMPGADD